MVRVYVKILKENDIDIVGHIENTSPIMETQTAQTEQNNMNPDKNNLLKSLNVMKTIIEEIKTHVEDTENNEESSLKVYIILLKIKIDKIEKDKDGRIISHMKRKSVSKISIKPNPNHLEVIEEKSINNVK